MELESRLGTLEDEFKVLKAEIRQTLLDVKGMISRYEGPIGSTGTRVPAPEAREPEERRPIASTVELPAHTERRPGGSYSHLATALGREPAAQPWAAELPESSEPPAGWDAPRQPTRQMAWEEPRKDHYQPSRQHNGAAHGPWTDQRQETWPNGNGVHVPQSSPDSEPWDINVTTGLIRWAGSARQQLEDPQTQWLLDVCTMSGHLDPRIRRFIEHLACVKVPEECGKSPVGPGTPVAEVSETAIDLLLQLYGILAGASGSAIRWHK